MSGRLLGAGTVQDGQRGGSGGFTAGIALCHEIKYKKPQFQYNLYHECGFLCLISGCTPCPVLTQRIKVKGIALRTRYAISGTDIAHQRDVHGALFNVRLCCYQVVLYNRNVKVITAIPLRARCAMPGAAVLAYCLLCGTEILYAATLCYAKWGTGTGFAATILCNVRYCHRLPAAPLCGVWYCDRLCCHPLLRGVGF
eukprot:3941009-Rhodomonas_salina.7